MQQRFFMSRGLGLQPPKAKHNFCVYQESCFLQSLSRDFMGHPRVLYASICTLCQFHEWDIDSSNQHQNSWAGHRKIELDRYNLSGPLQKSNRSWRDVIKPPLRVWKSPINRDLVYDHKPRRKRKVEQNHFDLNLSSCPGCMNGTFFRKITGDSQPATLPSAKPRLLRFGRDHGPWFHACLWVQESGFD